MSGAAWDDARARAALRGLFDAAVGAADPRRVLAAHLPAKPPAAAASSSVPASPPP